MSHEDPVNLLVSWQSESRNLGTDSAAEHIRWTIDATNPQRPGRLPLQASRLDAIKVCMFPHWHLWGSGRGTPAEEKCCAKENRQRIMM